MSFGGSPGDIIIVIELATALFRKCKAAGDEYYAIAGEVGSLRTVLRHLKHEADAPDSLLNRDRSKYRGQLIPIIGNCDHTLQQLEELLRKHGKLADDKPNIWDRIRFAHSDIDSLNDLRMKLNNHKTTITVFLDTVQLKHAGYVSKTLENHGGQLDLLLDKVDKIAERMGQRANSTMTNVPGDNQEVWKEFRRELIAEGFSSDVLQRNKDVLRAYIREIDQKGLLTEIGGPLTPILPDSVSNKWLDSVAIEQQRSPEIGRIRLIEGVKELVVHEENMKFQQSMKEERARPIVQDASRDIQHGLSALGIDTKQDSGARSVNTDLGRNYLSSDGWDAPLRQSQISIVQTSDLGHHSNLSGNEQTLLRAAQPRRPPRLHVDSAPNLNSRSTSPMSTSSQISNRSRPRSAPFDEHHATESSRSFDHALDSPGRASEPVAIPERQQRISEEHPRSPRSGSLPLAPDSRGNPIPLDAKWTKIKRSLVSLEILDQDEHRYEARPDFVAVLGLLNHQEIEELASRSKAVREARRQRPRTRETPRPPSPGKAPQNFPSSRQKGGGYHTTSDESSSNSSSSSSESDQQYRPRHKERRKRNSRKHPHKEHSYTKPPYTPPTMYSLNSPPPSGYQLPVQGYAPFYLSPNSHGMVASPQSNLQQSNFGYYPSPQPYMNPPSDNRGHSRRRGESDRHRSRGKDVKKETPRTRGWRENLMLGAGIGGAAGSLLSVLSEAAAEL